MSVDNSSSSKLPGSASLRRSVSMTRIPFGRGVDVDVPFIRYEHAAKSQVSRKLKNVVDDRGFATFDAMHFGILKTSKTRRRSNSTVDQGSPGLLACSHSGNSEDTPAVLLPGTLETTDPTAVSSESNQSRPKGLDLLSSLQYTNACSSSWPENDTAPLSPYSPLLAFRLPNTVSGSRIYSNSLHIQMPSRDTDSQMNDQFTVPGTPVCPPSSSVSGSWMSEPSPSSYFSSTASTSPYSPLPPGMSPFHPREDSSSWNATALPNHPNHSHQHYFDPHGLSDLKSEHLPCGCLLITNLLNEHVGVVKSTQSCWYSNRPRGFEGADFWCEGESEAPDGYRVPITSLQRPDLSQSMSHANRVDDGAEPSASNLSLDCALDRAA